MPLHLGLGRLLQTSPAEPGLGAGLIVLIVFGVCALVACILACGKGQVTRVTVFCASSICYTLLALLLICLPRDPRLESGGLSLVTDYTTFLRVLFLMFISCCSVAGLAMVLCYHAKAPQKAPRPPDIERNELVRLAR